MIISDQDSQFVSNKCKIILITHRVNLGPFGVKINNDIGVEDRYYSYLRQTYLRIRVDSPGTSQELALSLALRLTNDRAGPDGLSLPLLIWCCYEDTDSVEEPPEPDKSNDPHTRD